MGQLNAADLEVKVCFYLKVSRLTGMGGHMPFAIFADMMRRNGLARSIN